MAKLDTAGRPTAPTQGSNLGSVTLVLGGAMSLQFGAAVAALLFDRAGSLGVVTLRLGFAAVLLCLLLRPRVRGYSRADWAAVAAFGLTLASMNTLFYQAIERIPLGAAVTLEVLGPLVLSVVASRRPASMLWAVLALGGVFLLGRGGFGELNAAGVAFALCAGVLWATYIVLSAKVGGRFPRADGVALALVIGGLATLPLGVAASGEALLDPVTLVLGAAVAVLSSMLPYSLELLALRRLAASTFAVLMSLEPALAALAGFLVLRQGLSPLQSLGIALVIAASVGAVRMRRVGRRERHARVAEQGGGDGGPLPPDPAGAPVGVPADRQALREAFGGPLPEEPTPAGEVLAHLERAAEPGLVATAGPRFFGFVTGGALPAATAADMLAVGWDQCAFNAVLSPAAAAAEEAAGAWLKDLLGLPATASTGFVTGGQGANTAGLATARHQVLADAGWDTERDGLAGAPRVRVVASAERHATIDRSLRLLGLGTAAVEEVRAGANGEIDLADLARVLERGRGPLICCLQAGNVNTGACDDLRAACELVRGHGGWAHVDGAFGLWAAASAVTAPLVDGVELADSWACDGHKWLNVPYDSGFAFCARPAAHAATLSFSAAYLVGSGGAAELADFTPESSRRARGFAVWAALRELGRAGVARLVDRCCLLARRFAGALADGGAEIGNDVVLNQVLARFGDDARTDRVVEAVQRDGTCWLGGTTWRGRRYLRIAVSNHATTEADIDRSAEAVLRAAARQEG